MDPTDEAKYKTVRDFQYNLMLEKKALDWEFCLMSLTDEELKNIPPEYSPDGLIDGIMQDRNYYRSLNLNSDLFEIFE